MTGHLEWFSELQPIPEGQWPIPGISSQVLYTRGIGRININRLLVDDWRSGYLEEVLYIPDLPNNLFSLSSVATKGVDTICFRNQCYFMLRNRVLMEGLMENMLYRLLIRVHPPELCLHAASLGTSSL
jgi:hypothetical protein